MSAPRTPDLSPNHRRSLGTTLALLDELLGRVDEWAQGRERHGALRHERNALTPEQRRRLLARSATLRREIERAGREAGLAGVTQDAASDIWSRCAAFREGLMELEGERLSRYGALSPEGRAWLDDLSAKLLDGLDDLVGALFREGKA